MKFIKFGAAWCGSCKTLEKSLDGWDAKIKGVLEAVDIDKDMPLARKFKIKSLPTVVVVNEAGEEVDRLFGAALNEQNLAKHIA